MSRTRPVILQSTTPGKGEEPSSATWTQTSPRGRALPAGGTRAWLECHRVGARGSERSTGTTGRRQAGPRFRTGSSLCAGQTARAPLGADIPDRATVRCGVFGVLAGLGRGAGPLSATSTVSTESRERGEQEALLRAPAPLRTHTLPLPRPAADHGDGPGAEALRQRRTVAALQASERRAAAPSR